MMTISKVEKSSAATHYFSKDNYYTDEEGISNSQWQGLGAEYLGLDGKVDPKAFKEMLDGQVGGVQLGRVTSKGLQHRPGWDLTFSAPKSLSILSEVYGVSVMREAHELAVSEALSFIEKNWVETRLKEGDLVKRMTTGNAIIATFTHDVSRELEPQVHTHSIFMNATHTLSGWRSLSPEKLFEFQMQGGMAYRAALARQLLDNGFELKPHRTDSRLFEIKGVPDSLIDEFSTRASQIKQYFEDRGITYNTTMAKQVALLTRKSKKEVDRKELAPIWLDRAKPHGIDQELINQKKTKKQKNKEKKNTSEANEKNTPPLDNEMKKARRLVRIALNHLAERDMSFSLDDLAQTSLSFDRGGVRFEAIHTEMARLMSSKALIEGAVHKDRSDEKLYTTPKAKLVEETLIDHVKQSKGYGQGLVDQKSAEKFLMKNNLNVQQREAVLRAVTSNDRLFGIQGDPGVGKTHTLKEYKNLLNKNGYEVLALAPTYQAVSELSSSLNVKGMTVDRYLVDPNADKDLNKHRKQVWIVDEASMLSTDKINHLTQAAIDKDARIVFVGDHKQLESVDAGRGFKHLQDARLDVAVIDKIMRQKTEHMQQTVEKIMTKDYASALDILDKNKGLVVQPREGGAIDALVENWLSRTEDERRETLIVAPTQEQRQVINAKIRDGLQQMGTVDKHDYQHQVFDDNYFTEQEKKLAQSYTEGDVVRFSNDYEATDKKKKDHIARHEYFEVIGTNVETNTLALRSRKDNRMIFVDPKIRGAEEKGKLQVFSEKKIDIAKGDKIKWMDNTNAEGLKRNTDATVVRVASNFIRIELEDGKRMKLDLNDIANHHFQHNYARTAYGVQGKTDKEVLALMQSWRRKTVNEKSFMVAVTRASHHATVFTDSKAKLSAALSQRSGENTEALTKKEFKRAQRAKEDRKNTNRAARSLI